MHECVDGVKVHLRHAVFGQLCWGVSYGESQAFSIELISVICGLTRRKLNAVASERLKKGHTISLYH